MADADGVADADGLADAEGLRPTGPMSRSTGSARDRRVLAVLVAIVVSLLALNIVSALVPGMDAALAGLPIVGVVLVAGTLLVMSQVVRRR